jgi:phosphopantothenoylcysteine decarboxylase/phosphopantothenate--cysteine ligase
MSLHIALVITGSIAAYKSLELIRLLIKAGHTITPVMTKAAEAFVTPRSVSILSNCSVILDKHDALHETPHIELARRADIVLVAPCTANCIAKFAHGLADDIASMLILSFQKKITIAPAMHSEMWHSKATQKNIAILKNRGVTVIGPEIGDLASGDFGEGRMCLPEMIVSMISLENKETIDLRGRSLLITLGGTREALDSVRVISNNSSGKMGEMIARMAYMMGAEVHVVTTLPIHNPGYASITQVSAASEMNKAVHEKMPFCDTLFMAAAVSDFKPTQQQTQKIKRQKNLTIEFEGTEDILVSLKEKKENKLFIGFCLTSDNLIDTAKEKRIKKNLDFIIANTPDVLGKDVRSVSIIGDSIEIDLKNESVASIAYHILDVIGAYKEK